MHSDYNISGKMRVVGSDGEVLRDELLVDGHAERPQVTLRHSVLSRVVTLGLLAIAVVMAAAMLVHFNNEGYLVFEWRW